MHVHITVFLTYARRPLIGLRHFAFSRLMQRSCVARGADQDDFFVLLFGGQKPRARFFSRFSCRAAIFLPRVLSLPPRLLRFYATLVPFKS